MKNNKGVTLSSLVIYITLIFVVLAILMRITTYFSGNIKDMADVDFETEFNKLNLYLLDESKEVGNEIVEIVEGITVYFSNGNRYSYNSEENVIYLNDSIKICENVEYCLFEQKTALNGKSIIAVTIEIDDTTKTEEYVMKSQITEETINELDYILEDITNVATE